MANTEFASYYSISLIMEETRQVQLEADDILKLFFVEDIMSPSISGKLIFRDKYGIMEYGPFTGEEKIVIDYGVVEDRQLIFEIWKIKAVRQSSVADPAAENVMEIDFVDVTFLPLTLRKYSRSFGSGATYDSIINHILKQMLEIPNKFLKIDSTTNTIDNYIMPYWTPLQTIKFLSARAVDANGSGFLFYASTEESWRLNFRNINTLFSYDNTPDPTAYIFESKDVSKKNKILEWWINGLDKFATRKLRGGQYLGYDFTTKNLLNQEYTYDDGVDDSMLVGRKSLFPDISDSDTEIMLFGDNSLEMLKNRANYEWVTRYSMQQIVNFIVAGDENRYAGQLIEVKWPGYEKRQNLYNKMLKGYFLVKSVTHMFTGDVAMPYRQRLVCMKNAYYDTDTSVLKHATKINLADIVRLGNV